MKTTQFGSGSGAEGPWKNKQIGFNQDSIVCDGPIHWGNSLFKAGIVLTNISHLVTSWRDFLPLM